MVSASNRTGRCTALSESHAISVGFEDVLLVLCDLDGHPEIGERPKGPVHNWLPLA